MKSLEEAVRLARETVSPHIPGPVRWSRLGKSDIAALEKAGCSSDDWSGVTVSPRTGTGAVSNCRFEGTVRIDAPPGCALRSSTIRDCVLLAPLLVDGVGLLQGYTVLEGAEVSRCSTVRCRGGSSYGIGMLMRLGCETGERDLHGFPTLSPELAAALSSVEPWAGAKAGYEAALSSLASEARARAGGLIGRGAVVTSTQLVEDALIGDACRIEAACSVRDSILLGSPGDGSSICDGGCVSGSALQWGSSVTRSACLVDSILAEGSVAEGSARITSSFVGPDSRIGGGEVTASLLGPQVMAHHESLLIAVRWPGGCGNAGYGANVGSNHTSRLPDQEIAAGTGVFFGLGCSIKFPCSLEDAPGTVVATGTVLGPQRIEYPFSLLAPAAPDAPGAAAGACELRPGWVIYGNMFSLLRNMAKIEARRNAVRGQAPAGLDSAGVALLAERARDRLKAASGRSWYGFEDIPGTGACIVSEHSRSRGVGGYDLFIAWLCLRAFAREAVHGIAGAADDPALSGLMERELRGMGTEARMRTYSRILTKISEMAVESRARDYARGAAMISDYGEIHLPPGRDPVLQALLRPLEAEKASLPVN